LVVWASLEISVYFNILKSGGPHQLPNFRS